MCASTERSEVRSGKFASVFTEDDNTNWMKFAKIMNKKARELAADRNEEKK